jgi:hypothetical protein
MHTNLPLGISMKQLPPDAGIKPSRETASARMNRQAPLAAPGLRELRRDFKEMLQN